MRKVLLISLLILIFPRLTHAQVLFSGDSLISFGYISLILPYISRVYAKSDIWVGYPILKRICGCESAGSPDKEPIQFDEDENPFWSQKGTKDVGACQISIPHHKKELKKLGLDVINSFEDNVSYAKILYDRNGVNDWRASLKCWIK